MPFSRLTKSSPSEPRDNARAGFLMRLLHDKRGNALVVGTVALIPLAGMIGGGVDLSRMYMTKVRLQHACDAGALAGRRAMGGGSWDFNSFAARTTANRFFDGNWEPGAYGTLDRTRSYTESDGVVTGTATAKVPMTLTKIIDQPTRLLTVTCTAEMRLLNTDVMFVLDTTGSMNQTLPGDSSTKMVNLRVAVKCFYQILAQLDITDQDCDGDEPTGGVGADVQLRFGFVPYSTNVNVGRLLPVNFIADTAPYQTRVYQNRYDWSDWRSYDRDANSSGNCPGKEADTSTTQYTAAYQTYMDGSVKKCRYGRRDWWPVWSYRKEPINISGLKNGTGWNASFVQTRMGDSLQDETITWDGCIEERKTDRRTNYDPIPVNDTIDLDIDRVPSPGNPDTQWKPVLPDLHFFRLNAAGNNLEYNDRITSNRYPSGGAGGYFCPTASRRLSTYSNTAGATSFMNYVNALTPSGNTYHDIGMIWGQRLLSPTGIFAANNSVSSTGGAIDRHIIFMTDGDTQTSASNHTAYGVPWYDRRQTDLTMVPTDTMLDEQVNRRFEALCERGKGPFTIWVVAFGTNTTLTNDTLTRLTNCASPGRFFRATSGPQLQQTFRQIAEQIGQLRLRQ